jgi:putative hydrolase of the HAD superfamily
VSLGPLRAVFFDFAGTLFSDRALRDVHLQQLRYVAGIAAPGADLSDADVRTAYKQGMRIAHQRVAQQPGYLHRALFGTAFTAMAEVLGGRLTPDQEREAVDRQYAATIDAARLRPDAVATLEALRAEGLFLQIVSNIDDEQLDGLIDRFGIRDRFDALTTSQEAGSCKPDPGIYAYALAKAGCAASEVLFVGDSVGHDIEGPAAVGMYTAWLTADGKPLRPGETERVRPDLVIDNLIDLIPALARSTS